MIIATAGHVDHGKTSLVKQLTGVDTDRLEEEKRRGLSINLGFAYRRLSSECSLGFIDVPGHKRFINTMISGLVGIDLGMIVVAADDGLMPQTLEHIDAMNLLGITDYIVVLTKIDRVENDQVKKVSKAVLALLAKTSTTEQASPVFEVSNINGDGIEALQQALDQRALTQLEKSKAGFFHLSIDRVFTLKGAGLVVTGTVSAGKISRGDSVQLLPQGISLRVRSIHAQDLPTEEGQAGQRCALNVVGNIQKNDIKRGDCLVGSSEIEPTDRFSARFELLQSSPVSLKHMTLVKLYLGARHTAAKIYLLERKDNKALKPGDKVLVQIITNEAICCFRGEHFVLRDDSESFTLGGGMVLEPQAIQIRKVQPEYIAFLQAMEEVDFNSALQQLILSNHQVVNLTALKKGWNLTDDEANTILIENNLREQAVLLDIEETCFVLSKQQWSIMAQAMIRKVQIWHVSHPFDQGIKSSDLKAQLKSHVDAPLFSTLMNKLLAEKEISINGGLITRVGFKPKITDRLQEQWLVIEKILQSRGVQIPLVSELSDETGINLKELSLIMQSAVKSAYLYKVSEKRFGLVNTLKELSAAVNSLTQTCKEFTAVEYKNKVGIGRNFAIELLEYFDSIHFTQRRGNVRVVLDETLPEQFFK